MKTESVDRRVQRTRQLLNRALMALIVEKGYESITVQDIIYRAKVGRSTFYAHYQDKDDLLLSGMEEVVHSLVQDVENPPERMDEMFQELAMPGVWGLIGGRSTEIERG